MALLSAKDKQFLQDHLASHLDKPVKLLFFTQTIACQFCRETEAVLKEVAGLTDKITLQAFDFVKDKKLAVKYGVDKIPATVILGDGDTDYGVRFFGIPSGYEFTSLIDSIIDVSTGKTSLSEETLAALATLPEPVHIQVLVTPTCPYCPAAVHLAHSMAVASDKVRGDMVEAIEFPHLAHKYEVQGVPRIIINEKVSFEGAAPEPLFLARVKEAVGLLSKAEVDKLFTAPAPETPS
ncbi:MAG: protein disulfide oxidoreductase [Anaerolineae bacterium]